MFTKIDLNQYYRYCLSLAKNEEDAYDLLQAGLEKYLKKNGTHIEQPRSYLYRIFRNQFIDNTRKKKRWRVEEYQDGSNIALLKTEQFDDFFVHQDEADRILSYLPVSDRELLYLWAIEGFTVQEIADFMDIPKGTLLSRLHRIKKRLKSKISNPFQQKKAL